MRILQGLVAEAERCGYLVETARSERPRRYGHTGWTGTEQGHIVISADGCPQAVRVAEEGLGSRAYWETTRYWRGPLSTSRAPALSDYETGATGRLSVQLVPSHRSRGHPAKWSDRRSWTLEDKLPEVLREIEVRAAEQRHRERRQSTRPPSASGRGRQRWSGRASDTPRLIASTP